jgi:GNAT superfamily N-acetyltransferase
MSTDAAPGARPAGPGDLDRVVEIIVGAFYADPVWAWAFPDPDLRRAQHRRFWRLYVEGAARYSSVWLNAEETSAAVWIPPGGTELTPDQEASVEPLLIELLGRAGAARVMDAGDAFERAHPREPGHHYLSLLGTDPAHRGKGLGLALLRQTLTRADSDGLPAYLEASNPVNVPLYERYGFRPETTFALPGGGPEVTTMWREPVGETRFR